MRALPLLGLGLVVASCHGEGEWSAVYAQCVASGRCGDAGSGGTAGAGGGTAGAGGGTAGAGGGTAGTGGGTAGTGGGTAGTGGAAPVNLVFPGAPIDFGAVGAGTTHVRRVAVVNDGGTASGLLQVTTTGAAQVHFQVGPFDGCRTQVLQPAGTCDVDVTLNAPADAGAYQAALAVVSGGAASFTTPLTFTVAGPSLEVSPVDVSFGSVPVAQRPGRVIAIRNGGLSALPPLSLSAQPSTVFLADAGTCQGAALAFDAGCTAYVVFAPPDAGVYAGGLSIRAGSYVFDAGLSGAAFVPGALSLSPLDWDAGELTTGDFGDTDFTVRNTGSVAVGPLAVTGPAAPFALVSNGCAGATLTGNGTCAMTVRYQPQDGRAHTSSLVVQVPDAGVPAVIGLMSGRAIEYVAVTFKSDGGTAQGSFNGSLGIPCGPGCTVMVPRGTPVTVGVLSSGQFDQWSGDDCAGHAPTCDFVARNDGGHVNVAHIAATADLTVTLTGRGALDVHYLAPLPAPWLSSTGLCTGSPCVRRVLRGASVRLHASVDRTTRTFGVPTFTGCDASGPGWCDVTMNGARSVTASFSRANVAFVSSELYPTNLTGVAAYDARCRALAGDAGLWASPSDGGRWIAWMSDSSLPADRLDGGRGWVRVDGRLLERDAISANSLLTHPLNLTERNELSNATAVATGVNAANDCGDWTALSGTLGIGDPHKTSTGWASVGTNFCGPSWNIYCFEGNATTSLPPPPPIPAGGRRAFILRAALPTNTPNADQACANEATAIGFPNAANFIALRATTTASAVSRLNPDGGNWYRSDGVQLTRSPEDLIVRGELLATVDRFADGGLGNVQVMTGAASPIVPSSSVNESCVNWTAASGALIVGQTATADGRWWSDSSPAGACSGGVAYRVYCFER